MLSAFSAVYARDLRLALRRRVEALLPVVFFINNNAYAYSTPMSLQMAVPDVAMPPRHPNRDFSRPA
mgnify:CR=1 FL=1